MLRRLLPLLLLLGCDEWYTPTSPPLHEELLSDGGGYYLWWDGNPAYSYTVAIDYLDGTNQYTTENDFDIRLDRFARSVELTRIGSNPRRWHPGYSAQQQWPVLIFPLELQDTTRPFGIAFRADGQPVPFCGGSGMTQSRLAFWVDSTGTVLTTGADSTRPNRAAERVYIAPQSERFPARLAVAPPVESICGRTRAPLSDSSWYWLWLDRGIAVFDTGDHFALVFVRVSGPVTAETVRVWTSYQTRGGLRWVKLD